MKALFSLLHRYSAPVVIIGTILWSVITVALYRVQENPPDTIVLRLGHWQLEGSVREAMDHMAAEYQKLHPNVKIVQDAIPESIYGQWITTQLMGETAPDLLQVGLGLPRHLWIQYFNRYFIPLSQYIDQPNPYNVGTELEGIGLRHTIKDGMHQSYVEELQEYMTIPLSQFGVRVFYNRDLLQELTGLDEAPEDYREFLKVCELIRSRKDPDGKAYTPIAGSKYHLALWDSMMFDPLTFGLYRDADYNRDAKVSIDEMYTAFKTGNVDFDHPSIRAKFQMLREVTDYFQAGYTGLTRDEAVFLFAQQRAVFMATGTWDARSLVVQAEGEFEIGVMNFPLPSPEDPVYGEALEGPRYEKPEGGFPFAINRNCKHPEVALDFLLFLASQEQNEELNRIIGWIPSVTGTELDPMLSAFEPNLEGVFRNLELNLGGESWVKWVQEYSMYQVNRISYEELVQNFQPFYLERGTIDFREMVKGWQRKMMVDEQILSSLRGQSIVQELPQDHPRWIRYRKMSSNLINRSINNQIKLQVTERGRDPEALGPYEHSPAAMERIRATIRERLIREGKLPAEETGS